MDSSKVNNKEFSFKQHVKGKTIIEHKIRLEFKLSLEEYVLLDFIHVHNQTTKEIIFFKDYYRETGFIKEDIQSLFLLLKQKGLLIFNKEENRVDVCNQWKEIFSSNGYIDKLWKILPKGNKPTAKQRLPKVLKSISFDELKNKLIAYVKYCDTNNVFKKGLDVWLHPSKEHWNDPLVSQQIKNDKFQQIQKTSIKFKK